MAPLAGLLLLESGMGPHGPPQRPWQPWQPRCGYRSEYPNHPLVAFAVPAGVAAALPPSLCQGGIATGGKATRVARVTMEAGAKRLPAGSFAFPFRGGDSRLMGRTDGRTDTPRGLSCPPPPRFGLRTGFGLVRACPGGCPALHRRQHPRNIAVQSDCHSDVPSISSASASVRLCGENRRSPSRRRASAVTKFLISRPAARR